MNKSAMLSIRQRQIIMRKYKGKAQEYVLNEANSAIGERKTEGRVLKR